MAFVYAVDSGFTYSTHTTPDTLDPVLAIKESTKGFSVRAAYVGGMVVSGTALIGIGFRLRRWTTAGSGGTAITPSPRAIGTTASTTAADKQTALTQGTVSGAYQFSMSCGSSTPGGWMASDVASQVRVEAGSADEVCFNSVCGVASQKFILGAEIEE